MYIQIADHLLIPMQRGRISVSRTGTIQICHNLRKRKLHGVLHDRRSSGKNTNKAEFVLGEDTRVDFVNTLDPVIPTGADAGGCVTAALIFAAALAGAYFMLRRKEQDSD